MASDLEEAFSDLLNAKAEVTTGRREFILLDGRKIEALVAEITADDSFISGGVAQSGGFRCQVKVSACPQSPEKFTAIEVRGQSLQVLSVNSINGIVYEIQAGDPSSEAL